MSETRQINPSPQKRIQNHNTNTTRVTTSSPVKNTASPTKQNQVESPTKKPVDTTLSVSISISTTPIDQSVVTTSSTTVDLAPKAKNKRKKNKREDGGWTKKDAKNRRVNLNSGVNIFLLRSSRAITFLVNGVEQKLIQAAVINKDYIIAKNPSINLDDIDSSHFADAQENPVDITEITKNGSPLKGKVGDVEVHAVATNGLITILNNDPNQTLQKAATELSANNNFIKSAAYQAVKKIQPGMTSKKHRMDVSQKIRKKAKIQNAQDGSRNQLAEMAKPGQSSEERKNATATKYLLATELVQDEKGEYSHLGNHEMEGAKSQDADNMVCTTNHCNSQMVLVERGVVTLSTDGAYPDGFKVEIEAFLISNQEKTFYTQVPFDIFYCIDTKDFMIQYHFNGLEPYLPSILFYHMNQRLLQILCDKKNNKTVTPASTVSTSRFSILYSKQELAKLAQQTQLHTVMTTTPDQMPATTTTTTTTTTMQTPIQTTTQPPISTPILPVQFVAQEQNTQSQSCRKRLF